MTGWQPVETAPKDGTVVLVWTRTGPHLAAYLRLRPEGWMEKDGSYLLTEDTTGLPTHWMPLPVPPASNADIGVTALGTPGETGTAPPAALAWPFGPDEPYRLPIARG